MCVYLWTRAIQGRGMKAFPLVWWEKLHIRWVGGPLVMRMGPTRPCCFGLQIWRNKMSEAWCSDKSTGLGVLRLWVMALPLGMWFYENYWTSMSLLFPPVKQRVWARLVEPLGNGMLQHTSKSTNTQAHSQRGSSLYRMRPRYPWF